MGAEGMCGYLCRVVCLCGSGVCGEKRERRSVEQKRLWCRFATASTRVIGEIYTWPTMPKTLIDKYTQTQRSRSEIATKVATKICKNVDMHSLSAPKRIVIRF